MLYKIAQKAGFSFQKAMKDPSKLKPSYFRMELWKSSLCFRSPVKSQQISHPKLK